MDKSFFVDMGGHQPDGVHVGGEHHPGTAALFAADQISYGVPGNLVYIGPGQTLNYLGYLALAAGRAKSLHQPGQCFHQIHVRFLLSALRHCPDKQPGKGEHLFCV